MDALDLIERLDRSAALGAVADRLFDPVRQHFFKGVQFAEPAGDPGWFGPDSAVWYVHEHFPLVQLAASASAMIETLHPDMAWMAYTHTRAIERVDGVPTGRFDRDAMQVRAGHTFGFFLGVAMGPTAVAERQARIVKAMHDRIHGTRPDGREYHGDDPELLRWNYATIAWGFAAVHERYHPRPLRGSDLDEFYREYTRVGHALGATDLPETRAEVEALLEASLPLLGVTMPTVRLLNPLAPWRYPPHLRPLVGLVHWAVQDLQPSWAQELLNVRAATAPERAARRAAVRALVTAACCTGQIREVRESRTRAAAAVEGPPGGQDPERAGPTGDVEVAVG